MGLKAQGFESLGLIHILVKPVESPQIKPAPQRSDNSYISGWHSTVVKVRHIMLSSQIEELLADALKRDRQGMVRFLRTVECDFQIDFTDEYLEAMSLERLQHLVVAAGLHARNCPAIPVRAA